MVDIVRTEAELLANLFQDGQPDSSITAQDIRDLIVSIKYLNGGGWEFHLDGEYLPPSAARRILAGVRTKVTIDGAAGDFGHPATGHSPNHFWDVATNKVVPTAINNFAIGRFAVTAQSVAANENNFLVEVDVGGATPIIFQETGVMAKGAGVDQSFNFTAPLFVGDDFLANGGELYITPVSDMDFHTFALTINRTYLARP